MAAKKLLNCLKKRDLLNTQGADAAQLINLGERYLEAGRVCDCIDFFEKAGHRQGLLDLVDRCLDEGDYFLYQRLTKILSLSPGEEQWTQLGDRALAQGKLLFARSAYREAQRPEKLAQVESLLEAASGQGLPDKSRLH